MTMHLAEAAALLVCCARLSKLLDDHALRKLQLYRRAVAESEARGGSPGAHEPPTSPMPVALATTAAKGDGRGKGSSPRMYAAAMASRDSGVDAAASVSSRVLSRDCRGRPAAGGRATGRMPGGGGPSSRVAGGGRGGGAPAGQLLLDTQLHLQGNALQG